MKIEYVITFVTYPLGYTPSSADPSIKIQSRAQASPASMSPVQPCLEGSHTCFNALILPSWNPYQVLN